MWSTVIVDVKRDPFILNLGDQVGKETSIHITKVLFSTQAILQLLFKRRIMYVDMGLCAV